MTTQGKFRQHVVDAWRGPSRNSAATIAALRMQMDAEKFVRDALSRFGQVESEETIRRVAAKVVLALPHRIATPPNDQP
jgi:hypothetical protein